MLVVEKSSVGPDSISTKYSRLVVGYVKFELWNGEE